MAPTIPRGRASGSCSRTLTPVFRYRAGLHGSSGITPTKSNLAPRFPVHCTGSSAAATAARSPRSLRSFLSGVTTIKPNSSWPARKSEPTNHPANARTQPHNAGHPETFLTKEQLRQKMNLPSTRSIDELVRRRVIPAIRLGWRTVRFDWAAVRADLDKVTIKAVS